MVPDSNLFSTVCKATRCLVDFILKRLSRTSQSILHLDHMCVCVFVCECVFVCVVCVLVSFMVDKTEQQFKEAVGERFIISASLVSQKLGQVTAASLAH